MEREGDISSVMGFTGFGKPQKAARKFDLDAIFEKTKREAKTILSHNAPRDDDTSEGDDDMLIGPPISLAQPATTTTAHASPDPPVAKEMDSDEDSDYVGIRIQHLVSP